MAMEWNELYGGEYGTVFAWESCHLFQGMGESNHLLLE